MLLMEVIELKTNAIIKTRFDELPPIPNNDMINFYKILPCKEFAKLRKFV